MRRTLAAGGLGVGIALGCAGTDGPGSDDVVLGVTELPETELTVSWSDRHEDLLILLTPEEVDGRCVWLADDVTAELDGVPLEVRQRGGRGHERLPSSMGGEDVVYCRQIFLSSDEPERIVDGAHHRLVLRDASGERVFEGSHAIQPTGLSVLAEGSFARGAEIPLRLRPSRPAEAVSAVWMSNPVAPTPDCAPPTAPVDASFRADGEQLWVKVPPELCPGPGTVIVEIGESFSTCPAGFRCTFDPNRWQAEVTLEP